MNNSVYYQNFTSRNGVQNRILFFPNSLTRTENNMIPFGNVIINNDIVIKSQFEDDLPRGMEIAKAVEIEVDVTNISAELRSKILEGSSYPTLKTVDLIFTTIDIQVPNLWIIQKYDTVENEWIDVFIGVQTMTPSIKINAKDKYSTYSVNIIEVTKFILESITFDILREFIIGALNLTNANRLIEAECEFDSIARGIISTKIYHEQYVMPNYNTFKLLSIYDLLQSIQGLFQVVYNNLFKFSHTFVFDNPLKNVNFYKRGSLLNHENALGGILSTSELLIIGIIEQTSLGYVDGLLVDCENSFVREHKTIWDMFKKFAENNIVKYTFEPNLKRFRCNAIFSHNKANRALNNIQIDREIEIGAKRIARAITHLSDTVEGDIEQCEVNLRGVLNDSSEETAMAFQSLPKYIEDFKISNNKTLVGGLTLRSGFRRFYYNDGAIRKTHELVEVWLDDNQSITPLSPSVVPYPIFAAGEGGYSAKPNVAWVKFIRDSITCSYEYQIALAYTMILGSPKTALIEITVDNTEIDTSDLGLCLTISPEVYFGNDHFNSILSDKAIVTSIEENVTLGISKVKLFIRNDIWS